MTLIIQCTLWHIIASTFCATLLCLIFQGLNTWIAVISLLAGTTLAGYVCRPVLAAGIETKKPKWDWVDATVIGFILLIGLRQYLYLYFNLDNGVQTLLVNNYGDLPLHLTYIRNMVDGTCFPPDNPYFSLEKLRYPMGMDLYNALWEQIGVPPQSHLCAVGLVMLTATVMAMYRFGGILLVGAFFLNGGWAGWQFFTSGIVKDYQSALTWKNFFTTLFITQRGLLMALPLGLWLVGRIRAYFYDAESPCAPLTGKQATLIGLAWGVLPLFHMHAFIIVSLLIAFYVLAGPQPKNNLRRVTPILAWAIPVATPFVLYLTDLFRKGSMVHFQWNWFSPGNLAYFFGVELGPWAIFILSMAIYRLWKGNRRERAEWIMACCAFLIFNAVLLAPWDWDKLKVLIWFYFIIVTLSARAITPHLTIQRKAALCVVLFFSATICLLAVSGGHARPTRLYEYKELWNTKGAIVALPKNAVVAATPTFNHPLSFWGHKIAVGYSGHLWSHGVDFQTSEKLLEQLYKNGENWKQIANRLGLTHIFWGPMEKQRFGGQAPIWRTILPNLSPVPGYEIYYVLNDLPAS